jgi:hypothetical protein
MFEDIADDMAMQHKERWPSGKGISEKGVVAI